MLTSLAAALVGLTFGLRHALEPDHLAAVSTLATEQRTTAAATRIGLWWGLGHALTLLLFGGSLCLLQVQLPEAWASGLELVVAVMIVGLGIRALVKAVKEGRGGPVLTHTHGATVHTHAVGGSHLHLSRWVLATRPLLIGAMHGLAGSGALTAIVLLELPTAAQRLSYIVLFGLGATLGMGGLTALYGVPLSHIGARAPRLSSALLGVAGVFSIGLGLVWGALSAERLFV